MNFAMLTSFLKESGMRKVGSCLAIQAANVFLLSRGVLPSNDYVTLTLVVLDGIVGGNAIEHALKTRKEPPNADPKPAAGPVGQPV